MSPVSSSKVSDPGTRVHVPFTLSETWTCPGALYWLNHPTSRSPWPTGEVSVTVVAEIGAVENAAPWTKVGVVDWAPAVRGSGSPRAAITARAAADRADGEWFTDSLYCDTCSAPLGGRRGQRRGAGHAARSVSSAIMAVWPRPPAWLRAKSKTNATKAQHGIATFRRRARKSGRRGRAPMQDAWSLLQTRPGEGRLPAGNAQ